MKWLRPSTVAACEAEMARRGVAAVARGAKPGATLYGFMEGYLRWGRPWGSFPARPGETWAQRRAGFLARHLAQVERNGEPLWRPDGSPTDRHLALVAWAYSPEPARLLHWINGIRDTPPAKQRGPVRPSSTPRR